VQYFSPDGKIGNFTSQSDFMSSITFANDYRDSIDAELVHFTTVQLN